MMAPIFRANSALASASAGRGWPRSANTLRPPTTYAFAFLAIALLLCLADLNSQLETSLDEIDVRLRRRDAVLRLLLEGVQHEHSFAQAHRIHRPKRIARWSDTISSTPGPKPL